MSSSQSGSPGLQAEDYLVILNFGNGSCQAGFPDVRADVWQGNNRVPAKATGSLPNLQPLVEKYQHWQRLYRLLYGHPPDWRMAVESPLPDFELELDDITNVSSAEFRELSHELETEFNHWFNTDGFQQIDRCVRMQLVPTAQLRIMISAQDKQLLSLPWCRWSLLEDYPKAEIALSPSNYAQPAKFKLPKEEGVNILGVFGNADGLDLSRDHELLKSLPDVRLRFLERPSWEELSQVLWSKRWDVLFFAGHSSSQDRGYIQLNDDERIEVSKLKYALRKASEGGLQLAILNSCDGLGLAWDLVDLKIPQVIAMREPVADKVAQEFLKYFLQAFSSGQTLYLSVREAREKLHPLDAHYGCASWLPVIVQNPAEKPPSWRSLTQGEAALQTPLADRTGTEVAGPAIAAKGFAKATPTQSESEPLTLVGADTAKPSETRPTRPKSEGMGLVTTTERPGDEAVDLSSGAKRSSSQRSQHQGWGSTMVTALVVTAVVFGLRWLGVLMPLEQWALDQLMGARASEGQDDRLLIVTIDDADIKAQASLAPGISLSDESLSQLLEKLSEARVVGLDLYRDFAVDDPNSPLVERLQDSRLIGICKAVDSELDPEGIAPPPEIPSGQIGFSDFLPDPDDVIRRQVISMEPNPDAACTADLAFSTQLVSNYFARQGIEPGFTEAGDFKLGDQVFPRWRSHMGGYQSIDANGNQLLINYRALRNRETIAPTIPLRKVLSGELNPDFVRDRIVLVGVIVPSRGDFWETPFGSDSFQKLSGVEVHAHMVSQLLSAVLDDRPLIWAASPGLDGLWIWAWSMLGGLTVIICRGNFKSIVVVIFGGLLGLTVISFIVLGQGGWMPLIPGAIALPLTATAGLVLGQEPRSKP